MAILAPGYFGKLPGHGDFLRAEPAGAPLDLIDAWLAPARLGANHAADAALDAAGPVLALVRSRGQWWALALFPSRDAVGRRYPFCVLAGLPAEEVGGETAVVPAACAPFLVRCLHRSAAGWPADQAGLRAVVAGLGGQVDLDAEEHRLVGSLGDESQGRLWSGLLGRADDPRRAGVWSAAVAAGRSGEASCGLRLAPLAQLHHLAFWIMLLRFTGREADPSLIAIHPGLPGRQPSATLVWGRPTAAECLAALWPSMPGAATTRLVDPLAASGGINDAPEFLDEPDLSLREVLHLVGSATQRITRRTDTSRYIRRE